MYCECKKPKKVKVSIDKEIFYTCSKNYGGCGKEITEKRYTDKLEKKAKEYDDHEKHIKLHIELLKEFEKMLGYYSVKDEFYSQLVGNKEKHFNEKPEMWLIGAFRWKNALHGKNFWSEINEKWLNKLKEIKNENNNQI
jgi:hypothetical protein